MAWGQVIGGKNSFIAPNDKGAVCVFKRQHFERHIGIFYDSVYQHERRVEVKDAHISCRGIVILQPNNRRRQSIAFGKDAFGIIADQDWDDRSSSKWLVGLFINVIIHLPFSVWCLIFTERKPTLPSSNPAVQHPSKPYLTAHKTKHLPTSPGRPTFSEHLPSLH